METRWWRDATSGAAAGMVSVLALHPLDVIKTRLQVQDGVDRRAAAYRGTVHAFRTVARQEGARGFYAGVVPAVVGSTVSWGVYFTCYNNAKARYRRAHDLEHLPSHLHLASAAEAGLVVSLATNPIWVVKTRLQLQKNATPRRPRTRPPSGRTAGSPMRWRRSHGPKASRVCTKVSGRACSWCRTARCSSPRTSACACGALERQARRRRRENARTDPRILVRLALSPLGVRVRVAGGRLEAVRVHGDVPLAGGARAHAAETGGGDERRERAATKTRAPPYDSFSRSLRDIVRREGASGLYKGMVPNVLRTLPSSGVTFMVYESVRSFLGEEDEEAAR